MRADGGQPGISDDDTSATTPGTSTGGASSGVPGSRGTSGSPSETSSSGATPAPGAKAMCAPSTSSAGLLKAVECIPSNPPAKAGLVVALHGYTQGVEQGGNGQAWGFYVFYPDKGSHAFSWYTFFGTTGIGRNDLEPSNIAKLAKDFIAAHDVAPNKVFINGLSAGAYMTVVMLSTNPDLFAGGSTFAGGAYGRTLSCAALGKKGSGWTWPGNHSSSLVKQAYSTVWNDANARKPKLLMFQGDADGAVTMENFTDLTQQWKARSGSSASARRAR